MLNQERVREMTRLAIFDKNEGKECKPMTQYFRGDYIAKEMLKSVVAGTVAFAVVAAMGVLYWAEDLLEKINSIDFRKIAVSAILCYVAYLSVYLIITYLVYYIRYARGRQKIKKYYIHLKKVNKIYFDEEEQM